MESQSHPNTHIETNSLNIEQNTNYNRERDVLLDRVDRQQSFNKLEDFTFFHFVIILIFTLAFVTQPIIIIREL